MKTNHSFEKHKALLFLYLFNYKPSQVTGIIKGAEKLFLYQYQSSPLLNS